MKRWMAYDLGELEQHYNASYVNRLINSGYVDESKKKEVGNIYRSLLYNPGFALNSLLFVATIIAFLASFGLFLLGSLGEEIVMAIILLGLDIAILVLLEKWVIESKKHLNSGLSEAILCLIGIGIPSSFYLLFETTLLCYFISLLTFLVAIVRYASKISVLSALVLVILIILYTFGEVKEFQILLPFLFATAFGSIAYFTEWLLKNEENWPWNECLVWAKNLSYFLFYISFNPFVVNTLEQEYMGTYLFQENLLISSIFWAACIVISPGYLIVGTLKKNIWFIRLGLISSALTIGAFRLLHPPVHPEPGLIFGGLSLMILGYFLYKKINVLFKGFTAQPILTNDDLTEELNPEIAAEILLENKSETADTKFGGGDFGGGGAKGEY